MSSTCTRYKLFKISGTCHLFRKSIRYDNIVPYGMVRRCLSQHALIPISDDKPLEKRFIPMTRKTLIRKVTETTHLVGKEDQDMFFDFTTGLEASLSKHFNESLREMKQLYDPLNPDKDTLLAYHVGKKEKQEQEFWLLQKLSTMLEKAHFKEIPRTQVAKALDEHPVYEGVRVKVDMKDFEVIRIWGLGEEHSPLHYHNWRERIRNFAYVYLKKWPDKVVTYKRVVVAVRGKKQNKLVLKAFKDIPQNGLEYILPEGKILISKYDKSIIATTGTIGILSLAARWLSSFAELNLSWTTIVGGMTGLLALNSWNAFKNKRNKYLVELSKTFYYKTLANNRALLTLVVDRAEDEVFKSALLAYIFIRSENKVREASLDLNSVHMDKLITVSELGKAIESWMKHRVDLEITFEGQIALKQLEELGLLKTQKLGNEIHLKVVPLEESLVVMPTATNILMSEREEEELDIEDVIPTTDNEIADAAEKEKQRIAEQASPGWQ